MVTQKFELLARSTLGDKLAAGSDEPQVLEPIRSKR